MMITRESDYAIRMIRALKDGEQLTIGQICQRELVPRQFAYKILKKLEKAGLVTIRRGAGGGCSLRRSLKEMTLLDIIQATDQEFFLNPCLGKGYHCEYVNRPEGEGDLRCRVHCELARIQLVLEQELKRATMEQIIDGDV